MQGPRRAISAAYILDRSCAEGNPLTNPLKLSFRSFQSTVATIVAGLILALSGCGGSGFSPAPITLSVSISNKTIVLHAGGTPLYIPVTIVAPTETATFNIQGLPGGVSESYKESESNPSGLLTLSAASLTVPGTYTPTIIVGSSGQTASFDFTLVVTASAN